MFGIGRSIRTKIIAIILTTSATAFCVGLLAISVNFYNLTQEHLVSDAESKAALIATNAAVPISFADKQLLNQLLQTATFNAEYGIAIFDNTHTILASKISTDDFYISKSEFESDKKTIWADDKLFIWLPIEQPDGEMSGVLYLKVSTKDFYQQIRDFTVMSILIALVLMFFVFLVSTRLQKSISEPIVELDNFSRKVSKSGNYKLRVSSFEENEIGSLARSFNQMLETIERKQKERDNASEALKLNKKRLERAVKDLQYLANYDSLTQLPNRALCMDRIKYSLKRAVRTNTMVAILFLDLDHFKDVNDSLGHAVGDQLLKATSQRLLEKIRREDTLARLGGDEFIILLNDINNLEDIISIVEKIVQGFETPFQLSSYEVNTTVSIGVCSFPQDGTNVDSLMKAADAAMYKAKEVGRNTYEFYEASLNKMATRRHQLANELRQAIKNEEFRLVYQPQLDVKKNKVMGAEVLLRWHHPILGSISPAEFVPIAESTGLIREIGNWVLENACRSIAGCIKAGVEIRLAINLSAAQFRQIDLPEIIAGKLQKYRIPPRLLEVEITESMLMRDVTQAIDILEHLKDMQIRIAIDDFGTGYSSLAYLRRFPLDALKVDRSFIDELVVDQDDTAITMAIISMAKSLRLEVIAEGVETQEQLNFLMENGCDEIQGYYFSKPLEFNAFVEFIKKPSVHIEKMS